MNRSVQRVLTIVCFLGLLLVAATLSVDRQVVRRLILPDSSADPAPTGAFISTWAADPLWKDGLAEVSTYDAERVLDGSSWRYRTAQIVLVDSLDSERLVRAELRDGAVHRLRVLSLIESAEIPAPNGGYHFLTTVSVRHGDPFRLVKATAGIQEWRGNTFKEIGARDGRARMLHYTHSGGVENGSIDLDIDLESGGVLTEQLPISLRSLRFEEGAVTSVRLLDPIAGNRASRPGACRATITVAGKEPVSCGPGTLDAWRVVVMRENGAADTFWFEAASPHALVRLEAADGRRLLLASRERRALDSAPVS